MFGHLTLSDMLGRLYWRTTDLRDAYDTACELTGGVVDLLVVRNEQTGNTVYFKNGRLSVYVKNGVEDWSK